MYTCECVHSAAQRMGDSLHVLVAGVRGSANQWQFRCGLFPPNGSGELRMAYVCDWCYETNKHSSCVL